MSQSGLSYSFTPGYDTDDNANFTLSSTFVTEADGSDKRAYTGVDVIMCT